MEYIQIKVKIVLSPNTYFDINTFATGKTSLSDQNYETKQNMLVILKRMVQNL